MSSINEETLNQTALLSDQQDFCVLAHMRGVKHPDAYDLEKKIADWRDNGFVVLKNAVSTTLIDEFLRDVDYLCSNRGHFSIDVEHKAVLKNI